MLDETQVIDNRKLVKNANGLLFATLLTYMASSFVIQFLGSYFGEQLPLLGNTMFQLLLGQAMLLLPSLIYVKKNQLKIKQFLHFKMLHPVTFLLLFVHISVRTKLISFSYLQVTFSCTKIIFCNFSNSDVVLDVFIVILFFSKFIPSSIRKLNISSLLEK